MDRNHPGEEVRREVADRVQLGIARLTAGIEMGDLGDWSAAKHANSKEPAFFVQVVRLVRVWPAARPDRSIPGAGIRN